MCIFIFLLNINVQNLFYQFHITVNKFQIDNTSIVKNKIIVSPETRLQTSNSLISLPLKPKHFIQRNGVNNGVSGQLRAKCLASMLTMHWQSEDIVIMEESPTLASVVDSSDKKKNVTIVKSKKVDTKDSTSSSG